MNGNTTTTTTSSRTTRVVVLGGSYGGVACINKLLQRLPKDSRVAITLVESRDARYHCIASYRALVQKDFAKNLWIPYTNLFPAGSPHKIVRAKVEHILHDHVLVAPTDDASTDTSKPLQKLEFDYLVIATGSMVPSPAKWKVTSSAKGIELMDKTRRDVELCKKIVVIGGGACGVEIAGEIKYAFPDKTVTLIHDMPALVDYPKFPDSFKNEARRYLEKQGVEVILNERVEIEGLSRENSVQRADRTVRLKGSDRTIESDLQFFSIGMQVDTSIMSTLIPPESSNATSVDQKKTADSFDYKTMLDPKTKAIRVKPTLQLENEHFPHIFAIGDVSTADPVPTCMAAVAAGETAARNLVKLIQMDSTSHKQAGGEHAENGADGYHCRSWNKLEDYVPIRPQMVLAMNPTGGVCHLPIVGTWFGSLAAWMVKSGDLFSGRFWSEMNMPRP
ncbi:Apoptosis-inducing factor 2 [Mortierella alpina]|uniref:Apoptosis-inducing factor 2 n=1 Tax=Mortierella alpina TaxID=64518 RepID=A0A9P6JDK5_MORAP|nr:Apoptosis-inducing factor 2 [Mortierella alpina]